MANVILDDDDPKTLAGTTAVDAIAALGGDDVILASEEGDSILFGAGADVLVGIADLLDGDLLLDFTREDAVIVTGETFASSAILLGTDEITIENVPGLPPFIMVGDIVPDTPVEFTSSIIEVDLNGDGGGDFTLLLNGDFSQRTFLATAVAGGTRITVANAAPTAAADVFTVEHDAVLSGDVVNGPLAGRDLDADGDAITISALQGVPLDDGAEVTLSDGTTLAMFADGTFRFDPGHVHDDLLRGESRTVTFDYEITDGFEAAAASVEITILGSARGSVMAGTGADDRLRGTAKGDELSGRGGDDVLRGLDGNDRLDGGSGADALRGGDGADRLTGARGRDRLFGDDGADRLDGGGGGDVLDGGAGRDVFRGGGGIDRFVFGRGDGVRDVIADFREGRETIEIESGARRFGQLDIRQKGDDVTIAFADVKIRLLDEIADDFDGSDFLFT